MSEQSYLGVGTTLAGGIQDIAALLPLLGTDQCEKHVGSALDGGYLYAAATPLSIFGSLGIVKLGVSVLVSSISIPKLSVSFKFNTHPKFFMTFRGRSWLGARVLDNAGFKPVGTVSSLIAMDGKRYVAETRLVDILKEKRVEDLERLSVEWKSTEWNAMLVICTMVAGGCGVAPYIPFISLPFRSSTLHSPWMFPLLRTFGSCLAAVCCQFLIQWRVISLMKHRIMFMIMDRTPGVKYLKQKNKESYLGIRSQHAFRRGWDESLPSEECLWHLERYLVPTQVENFELPNQDDIRIKLRGLQRKHSRPPSDRALIVIAWTLLFLSLPATVAGYIGCFTLVSGSRGKGPLIWLGLEAALSIMRILLWAWNPGFDEGTDIALRLELAEHQPLVTTEKNIEVGENTLALVPEHRFLEWIASYTGPLEQFRSSEDLTLYFTLTGSQTVAEELHLYLTVFDISTHLAVTLHEENGELTYIAATHNDIASEMEATLQSPMGKHQPWRANPAILFDDLSDYYFSITHALNRSSTPDKSRTHPILEVLVRCFRSLTVNIRTRNEPRRAATVLLPRKWNLLPKAAEPNNHSPAPLSISLTKHDRLYLQRGSEHHLKTKLIENWSSWIITDIGFIRSDARYDCHHALTDETCEKATWELIELEVQLAFEWRRREWSLLVLSFALENILHKRMEECAEQLMNERKDSQLKEWMGTEFAVEQRKRLEREKKKTKERAENEMKIGAERAEREGWTWRYGPKEMWEDAHEFIDKQWRAVIEGKEEVLREGRSRLDETSSHPLYSTERRIFVEVIKSSFTHWESQWTRERLAMGATIQRIRDSDGHGNLDNAYTYPEASSFAVGRFVTLKYCESQAEVCSATVYDVDNCDEDTIRDVIQKTTSQSLINVNPSLIIPENNHLLYLSFSSGHFQEPPFIQQNRDRWWNQQTNNSSTFYFSPQFVDLGNRYTFSSMGAIAHIFIFLQTKTYLRVRLLHFRGRQASVAIQERSNVLCLISAEEIPEQLQLGDFELDQLEPGRHELELVVTTEDRGYYGLRNIFVEFLGDLPNMDVERGKGMSNLSEASLE